MNQKQKKKKDFLLGNLTPPLPKNKKKTHKQKTERKKEMIGV